MDIAMLNFALLLFLQASQTIYRGVSDQALGSPASRCAVLLIGSICIAAFGLFVIAKTLLRWKSLRQPVTHLLGGISLLTFSTVVFLFQHFVTSNLEPLVK